MVSGTHRSTSSHGRVFLQQWSHQIQRTTPTANNYGAGPQNIHAGSGNQYISTGTSKQYNAETMNIVQYATHDDDGSENEIILNWLSPPNRWPTQRYIAERREDQTGKWLLEHRYFKDWLHGIKPMLWCTGMAGTGKTILTSGIVDYLSDKFSQKDNIGITYIYCSYQHSTTQTATSLVACLLRRLIESRGLISEPVKDRYKKRDRSGRHENIKLDECLELLKLVVASFSEVFVVIDALDECPRTEDSRERENFKGTTRDRFLSAVQTLVPKIHLLVTSRPMPELESVFEGVTQMAVSANEDDVKTYLDAQIKRERESGRLKDLLEVHGLKEEIVKTVSEKAQGMFLLARLHLHSIADCMSHEMIRMALDNLPTTLEAEYQGIMDRIEKQNNNEANLARKVLSWIFCAFQPLTAEQLRHALAVKVRDNFIGEALLEGKYLVSVCAGLVTIDEGTGIIRFAHYSVWEYMKNHDTTTRSHAIIAEACLAYISEISVGDYCQSDEELEARLQSYPFLEYASQHWGNHARTEPETTNTKLALDLLTCKPKLLLSNQVMHLPKFRYIGYSQHYVKDVTGLHISASFGLAEMVKRLLEGDAEVDARDEDGSTALHRAVKNEHYTVVEILLQKGVNVNVTDRLGRTALCKAVSNGDVKMVQRLLKNKANLATKDNTGKTAFHRAVSGGDGAMVRVLLPNIRDIETRDMFQRTALHMAVENNNESVVKLLLENGAVVNVKDHVGSTALHVAASGGQERITHLLLSNGADIAAKNSFGATALHHASGSGGKFVAKVLLDNGAAVDAEDDNGLTPLHWTATGNEYRPVTISKLLKFAASAEKDEDRSTALYRALENGYSAVAQLLLENEANTIGQTMCQGSYEEVVQLLLEKGADISATDKSGKTALHMAVSGGDEVMMGLLLEKGLRIDARDSAGMTALHIASSIGHEAIVRLLLEKGADLRAQDKSGKTALQLAESKTTVEGKILFSIEMLTGAYLITIWQIHLWLDDWRSISWWRRLSLRLESLWLTILWRLGSLLSTLRNAAPFLVMVWHTVFWNSAPRRIILGLLWLVILWWYNMRQTTLPLVILGAAFRWSGCLLQWEAIFWLALLLGGWPRLDHLLEALIVLSVVFLCIYFPLRGLYRLCTLIITIIFLAGILLGIVIIGRIAPLERINRTIEEYTFVLRAMMLLPLEEFAAVVETKNDREGALALASSQLSAGRGHEAVMRLLSEWVAIDVEDKNRPAVSRDVAENGDGALPQLLGNVELVNMDRSLSIQEDNIPAAREDTRHQITDLAEIYPELDSRPTASARKRSHHQGERPRGKGNSRRRPKASGRRRSQPRAERSRRKDGAPHHRPKTNTADRSYRDLISEFFSWRT